MKRRSLACVALVVASLPVAALTPPFEVIRDGLQASTVRLTDRNDRVLAEEFRPYQNLRLEWTPLRTLPQPMLRTLLMAEDQRFFEHSGVDWRAFVAALWQNLWSTRLRGASTLSMQMAGMLDPALLPRADHGGRRTIGQKWDQARAAAELEANWSKEQILEAYLNLAVFRGQLQGIGAAAWGLFRKAPAELDRAEAAILAVLLRAPDAPPRRVEQRACRLLRRIARDADCAPLASLVAGLDRGAPPPRHTAAAALLARVAGGGGQTVPSYVDGGLQHRLESLLGTIPAGRRTAVAIIDDDARVRAYAAPNARPDPLAERPPAELAARLLALARAVEAGTVGAASLLAEAPPGDDPLVRWRSLRGWLDEVAFAAVPFGPLLEQQLGSSRAVLAGVAGVDGPADALELLGLIASLSGDGDWREPEWRRDHVAAKPQRVLPPAAAYVWNRMWASVNGEDCNRWMPLTIAPEGALAAARLGRHSLLARAEGEGAADVLRALVTQLAGGVIGQCPAQPVPAGVVAREVAFDWAAEAPRTEWAIAGREAPAGRVPPGLARIVNPGARSIVDGRAVETDPDFRIEFIAWPPLAGLRWRLDGREVGRGGRLRWLPRAGLYRLELLSPDGSVVDRVEFAARGPL
ncbi:MAG: transglycosylase domain-containing protein [Zoogloeaceae bacterium]|nr:transglycosylase domain-containing protein [Rhodocyclaceae bacterium]MCP5236892.1 transglycosylase domain-containing protein [Zoogloeaceae bacterium]